MADLLKLLQECTTGRRELRELTHDDVLYFIFGDVAFPHDAKTNLSVYNKSDEYYSIESILYLWRNREMTHTTYVKDASGKGIQPITRPQRNALIEFLQGVRATLPQDTGVLAPIPTPIPVSRLVDDMEVVRKKPRLEQDDKGKRIDEILDQSVDGADSAQVRGLSSDLPAEKVAQLRTRVKKNLKNIVKSIEDDNFPSDAQIPDASADSVGKFLQSKERVWKNRVTCLESYSKDFSCILSVLSNIKNRDSKLRAKMNNSGAAPSNSGVRQSTAGGAQNASFSNGKPPRQSLNTGYSRYDQEIFQKDPIADFQIETGLSFHGASINTIRHIRDAAKPMGGGELQQKSSNLSQPNGSVPRPMHNAQVQQRPAQPQKRTSRTPIVVIPATGTALITMYNAMDILQDLKFVSTEEKKQKCRRENELLLQRRKNGGTVPYRVIDNPLKLKEDEWDRVVAVFVQGPAWQFKGWKWDNPVELFSHLAAFHLKFEEQKLDANVAKWSVNILALSKTKRHLDKAILHKFWDILDRHIAKSKPHLRF